MVAHEQEHLRRVSGVKAQYREPELACYQGNPLIEALPPIYTEQQVARLLQYTPGYEEHSRSLPREYRLHLIADAVRFLQPLSQHLRLEQCLSRMIRAGYVGRNPMTPHFSSRYRRLKALGDDPVALPAPAVTTRGCSLVGHSGAGKSTAVNRILSMYPQVIFHGRYQGRLLTHSQLVYLKLECPYDGTLSGLCKSFFVEVDRLLGSRTYAHYGQVGRPRVDDLLLHMAEVSFRHSIGVLVIDEIQNLRKAKGDGANDMLDFLLWLDNQLGIPIVLIGTPKALPVLTGEFRRARRAAGQEAIAWNRMQEGGHDWTLFTDALWHYQYVHTSSPLTPALRHALYQESQGIADIAVKVYFLAQMEAITNRTEVVTETSLLAASHHRLSFVQPFLEALRNRVAPEKIEAPEDLAEVNLCHIVEEELAQGNASLAEQEEPAPLSSGALMQEQQESLGALAGSSEQVLLHDGEELHQSGKEGSQCALLHARRESKQQNITLYETLKRCGYIRSQMEYFVTDQRGASSSEDHA